jgi:hypothetical protein
MEPTTVDDMLEDEDSLYENEEGDPEFSELIEDMADTVAEDMKAAQQDDPNPVVPPVVIDDESDPAIDYNKCREELDIFFHRRVFLDDPPVKWLLRNNLPRRGRDTEFDSSISLRA